MNRGIRSAITNIQESFVSVWTLMSDTTIFLSNHTKIFNQYEPMLRRLRHELERNRNDVDAHREVREQLVALRKVLRQQGYNLRLGSIDLKLEGFRNDDAMAEGFQRCVISIMDDGSVYYVTGTANHIDLDTQLDAQLHARRILDSRSQIGRHYLWFRWINRVLILSGAATETKEDFEELRDYVEENKGSMLKYLAKIS